MKNLKKLVVMLLLAIVILPINKVQANEKIKVYMFRGEGCPHCEEALEFFDELEKDEKYKDMYELVKYEVWYDEENAALMEKVAKELGEEASGVPYIVIGDKTFSGYAKEYDSKIKETIKTAYESDSYKDIVKSVKNGESTKSESEFPVVGVSITVGAAVLIIAGLIVLTKKL